MQDLDDIQVLDRAEQNLDQLEFLMGKDHDMTELLVFLRMF